VGLNDRYYRESGFFEVHTQVGYLSDIQGVLLQFTTALYILKPQFLPWHRSTEIVPGVYMVGHMYIILLILVLILNNP